MLYTYVRQHDTTDCAAACLAMVCLHYKKEITITRLRDMMGTDRKTCSEFDKTAKTGRIYRL